MVIHILRHIRVGTESKSPNILSNVRVDNRHSGREVRLGLNDG